jgi:hypothetical protein
MSIRQHGITLTYTENLDQLDDCMRRGGYDTVKVITGWGLPHAWTRADRERVLKYPNVIVRTVAGDPSAANSPGSQTPGVHTIPDPNQIQAEIADWYSIRPDIMIELGNEPNAYPADNKSVYEWCWFLKEAVKRCREVFPAAKLIAPGLMLQPENPACPRPETFLTIAHDQEDAMRKCDYIGIHIYDHSAFQPASKGELALAVSLYSHFFGDMPWYITEYGINEPTLEPAAKGQRYAGLVHLNESMPRLPKNVIGAVYYHLSTKGDNQPQYNIYPRGDDAYHQRITSAPAGGVLGEPQPTPTIPPFIPVPTPGVLGEPDSAPPDPFSAPLTAMIAALAEQERDATARRAQAKTDMSSAFTAADEIELRRIQAFQASLEAALSCAGDNSSEAQALAEAAARQVLVWRERQKALQ